MTRERRRILAPETREKFRLAGYWAVRIGAAAFALYGMFMAACGTALYFFGHNWFQG